MKKVLVLLVMLASFILIGCEDKLENQSFSVSGEKMIRTIENLSSETFAGRLTGTEGNYLAAEYIHEEFQNINQLGEQFLYNYSQVYQQNSRLMEETPKLNIVDQYGDVVHTFDYVDEFMILTSENQRFSGEVDGEIVVVEDLSDLEGSLSQKVFVLKDTLFETLLSEEVFMNFLSNDELEGLILVNTQGDQSYFGVSPFVLPEMDEGAYTEGPFVVNVFSETLELLTEANERGYKLHIEASYYIEEVEAENILYVIEGETDEVLLFGAHYDHAGDNLNGTFNSGALDNASGVSVVLELARLLSMLDEKPEKTIVFALFNGEEQYLYGSQHYVNHPLYSLDKTMMINIDSVGTKKDVPLQIEGYHKNDSRFIDLMVNEATTLGLSWTVGQSSMTDHAPFAEKGCEVINLIHPDFDSGYHSYLDTAENIDEMKLIEVVELLLGYLERNAYETLSIKK